jgi:hypothetical protein
MEIHSQWSKSVQGEKSYDNKGSNVDYDVFGSLFHEEIEDLVHARVEILSPA